MRAVTLADQSDNAVKLAQWVGGKINVPHWHQGRPGPGEGQLYKPLIPAGRGQGQPPEDCTHSSTIENTREPHHRMTHINAYIVPAGHFQCRPSAGGHRQTEGHRLEGWPRAVSLDHSGLLAVGRSGQAGACLSVLKGGRRLSRENIQAQTVSVPK